ncbi:hypothetical protein Hte_006853 [Hypoxylon texense]
MPPRLSLRSFGRHSSLYLRNSIIERSSVCLFCSLSPSSTTNRRPRRKSQNPRRFASTVPTTPITDHTTLEPRKELEDILLELQKHAANYVNLSRLQLALNGLRQKPGNESIRVAVLGLTNGSESSTTAKQVLKLLLADPLKAEEEWERQVDSHDITQPMIIRIGADPPPQELGSLSLASKGSLLHEINVSSATLNGHNLELLLMETNPFLSAQEVGALEGFEDSVLVPTVEIPTSSTGRHTPITTPVHKALLVTNGILGAASVVSMPTLESKNVVTAAVNLPEYKPTETSPLLPFTPIDVGTASIGLGLVRKDLKNAIEFEHLWFQSSMPKLVEWLKADIMASQEGATKQPVKELIASLLRNTYGAIESEKARQLGSSLPSTTTAPTSLGTLQSNLDDWAESAHTELQEQLDLAFSSRRWRKLGWWKLFWRVDDVGMLTNDIISQRFLPASERSAIFLAGRMKEAGVTLGPFPNPPSTTDENGGTRPTEPDTKTSSPPEVSSPWPVNIPSTRRYLQAETIPALQALAQKLTVQTLGTSGLTTALGALVYASTLTTTLYEAGAVAALGIIWSLRRMQKQWETARAFWEGEVREEGRKAVRGVEEVIGDALKPGQGAKEEEKIERQEELDRAKELVEKAQEVLGRLK